MNFAILCALVAVASARSVEHLSGSQFRAFKAEFGKTYSAEEEATRAAVFADNLVFIAKHNARFEAGLETYTVGVNQFADMSNEEWRATRQLSAFKREAPRDELRLPEVAADAVDWRKKGAVTPVKNQGQCGSCWSFSTTGSTEGAVAIAGGKLTPLSEQQLMDCSTAEGNQGCNGGLMDNAFKYIIKNGGLDSEADYPYTAKDGTCDKAKAAKHVASISGYKDVPKNEESQLAAAVAKGPVSVAIEADQQGFQMYKSGVFSGKCGTQLDHGVLVVGYTADAWIVKNSWGATWGAAGYIEMKRGVSAAGICGIAMQPSYPTAGAPGPSPPGPSPPPPGPSPPPPSPTGGHYEDPGATGTCKSDEEAVQITGLQGNFCSPKCSSSKPCPTDVPKGTTAQPECVLEMSGSSNPTQCALICDPSQGAGRDGCPARATCKAIQTTGICTYNK